MTPLEATAYHEAGHAVVALALGRQIQSVSIHSNRDHLGICEFKKGSARPSEDWIEREMLIAAGVGIAAEARHTGERAWDAARRDWRYVHSLAVERAGEPPGGADDIQRLLSEGGAPPVPRRTLLARRAHRRGSPGPQHHFSGRAARHHFEQGAAGC